MSADSVADQLADISITKNGKLTLEDVAGKIASGEIKKILVLTGAGISVSAGIPDFRTPGTGLYDNLQKYNLPEPTAVFEIGFFRSNPAPFFQLARELYPDGKFRPTPTHQFIRLLEERGLLLRNFTQNIDSLEHIAGLSPSKLIQAHGGFQKANCIDCKKLYPESFVKKHVFSDPIRIPRCSECNGLVKPAITFFGEGLPREFGVTVSQDFPQADLLIVMGTSLKVQPFASLISRVAKHVPRVLINMEAAGVEDDQEDVDRMMQQFPAYTALEHSLSQLPDGDSPSHQQIEGQMEALRARVRMMMGGSEDGFDFKNGKRDVFLQSDCDGGVRKLARMIGPEFVDRLEELIAEDEKKFPRKKDGAAQGADAAKALAKEIAKDVGAVADATATASDVKPVVAPDAQPATAPSSSGEPVLTSSDAHAKPVTAASRNSAL